MTPEQRESAIASLIAKGWAVRLPDGDRDGRMAAQRSQSSDNDGGWALTETNTLADPPEKYRLTELGREAADDLKMRKREEL